MTSLNMTLGGKVKSAPLSQCELAHTPLVNAGFTSDLENEVESG